MKRTFLALLFSFGFCVTLFAQEGTLEIVDDAQAIITFEKTSHDFGTIEEGTQATVTFKFTNTGNKPLVLTSVKASCGCTTPDWSREPIAPGEEGFIKATYNSQGRPNSFIKTITVKHNGEAKTSTLTIKGFVKKKEAAPTTPVENN